MTEGRDWRAFAREAASDVLMLAGVAAVVYAAWQVFPPAAWAIGGIASVAVGYQLGRGA